MPANKNDFPSGDMNSYFIHLNIKRGWMISSAILLFQLAEFAEPSLYNQIYSWIGFSFLTVISICFLLYYILIYKKKSLESLSVKKLKYIYISYWFFICTGMTAYFIMDARAGNYPFNFILITCGLIIIPVFKLKENFFYFSLIGILHIIVCVVCNCSSIFYSYTVACCFLGILLSNKTHKYYMDIISVLSEQTRTDYMTGLLNRNGAIERFNTIIDFSNRHGQICAFYMIDIDNFKQYNDNYGHIAGDDAIKSVSNCMKSCFGRKTDALCRYGGEEFAVAILVNNENTPFKMAENFQNCMKNTCIKCSDDKDRFLTVSIGIAIYNPKAIKKQITKQDYFIDTADQALYKAKNSGRNRIETTVIT